MSDQLLKTIQTPPAVNPVSCETLVFHRIKAVLRSTQKRLSCWWKENRPSLTDFESKFNILYLDFDNLTDDQKCASDLKQVSTFEEELFMSLMFANYELCFLGDSTQAQRKDMPTQFSKLFSELRLQPNTMM